MVGEDVQDMQIGLIREASGELEFRLVKVRDEHWKQVARLTRMRDLILGAHRDGGSTEEERTLIRVALELLTEVGQVKLGVVDVKVDDGPAEVRTALAHLGNVEVAASTAGTHPWDWRTWEVVGFVRRPTFVRGSSTGHRTNAVVRRRPMGRAL